MGHLSAAALSKCYAAADVFVLPSRVETQGMVAMEAMRFGVPILVSDQIVSARELVDDGGNGFLLDIGAEQDLVDKLGRLRHDPKLRESMGRRGREKAAAYHPGRIVNQLVRHYQKVQDGAAVRPDSRIAMDLVGRLSEGALN